MSVGRRWPFDFFIGSPEVIEDILQPVVAPA
jgi:hypothetical protein